MNHLTLIATSDTGHSDLDRDTRERLAALMHRDGLTWRAFLRRAVEAYDLMYSRSD